MSLRYKTQFKTETGTPYTINVWDDLYSGSELEFKTGPEMFTLSWEGQVDDIWQEVIVSKCEFDFIIEDQAGQDFIFDVATGEPQRFKVFIEKPQISTSLIWQGYLQGEGIEIEDEDWPTSVKLGCTDLGYLEDLPYMIDGQYVTGEDSIVGTVVNVLRIAGHRDFFNDSIHTHQRLLGTVLEWYSENMGAAVPFLHDMGEKTQLPQLTFRKGKGAINEYNCKQVIESVCRLFGAKFFQSDGVFRLQQIDHYAQSTMTTRTYRGNKQFVDDISYGSTITEVDRVNIWQDGGRTSVIPGVKYSKRQYNVKRNFLENITASNDNILNTNIGSIEPINGAFQVISLKFNLKYRITDVPPTTAGVWLYYNEAEKYYAFKPIFRLAMTFEHDISGNDYWLSFANVERTPIGIQAPINNFNKISVYRDLMLGNSTWRNYVTNAYGPLWAGVSLPAGLRYYEILPEDATLIDQDEIDAGTYQIEEKTIPIEIITPVAGGLAIDKMNDFTVSLELEDLYNSHWPQWLGLVNASANANDFVEWSVDDFELAVHGSAIEENPETGLSYRATNPDNFKKTIDLETCDLVAYDDRAVNNVKVWDGAGWIVDNLWHRDSSDVTPINLNKLSVREAVAMSRRGIFLWQGKLTARGNYFNEQNVAIYQKVLLKGIEYLILQMRWDARMNEFSNIYLMEVARNQTGITIEDYNSEQSRSNIGGGGGGSSSGGGSTLSVIPEYEFASGISASAFEPTIEMGGLASGTNDDINIKLWVFQDATKLHYPTGYDIDFPNNLIIPTYDFEDSNIELYLFP